MDSNIALTNQYIFLDESGKPEVFSAKGTNLVLNGTASKFLVITAIRCSDQLVLQQQVTKFKAELLQDKKLTNRFSSVYSLDSFHAYNDYPEVKRKFYEFIMTLDLKINVIVCEKLKTYPVLQKNPQRLYGVMAGQLLKDIVHQSEHSEIIFSRKDSKLKLRQEIEIEVENARITYMNKHPKLNSVVNISYFHNPHYTHSGLQIADYSAYAISQYFERGKSEWLELLLPKIGKIHDICNKKIYTKSNPLKLS